MVASEVRALAGRSAEAAKEIKHLINASVERVEQGTTLVDKAGTTMSEVVTSIRRVTDIMVKSVRPVPNRPLAWPRWARPSSNMDNATSKTPPWSSRWPQPPAASSRRHDLVQVVAGFSNWPMKTKPWGIKRACHGPAPSALVPLEPCPPLPSAPKKAAVGCAAKARCAKSTPAAASAAPATAAASEDDGWETFKRVTSL